MPAIASSGNYTNGTALYYWHCDSYETSQKAFVKGYDCTYASNTCSSQVTNGCCASQSYKVEDKVGGTYTGTALKNQCANSKDLGEKYTYDLKTRAKASGSWTSILAADVTVTQTCLTQPSFGAYVKATVAVFGTLFAYMFS